MTTGSEQLDRIVEQLPPTQPDGTSGCVPESRLWCRRGSLPSQTLGNGCSPSLLSSLLSLRWRRNFSIVVASAGTGSRPRSMPTKRRWLALPCLLARLVGQVEPVLDRVDRLHAFQPDRWPPLHALGVVRLHLAKLRPRHDRIHR